MDRWIEYRKQIKKPIKEATQETILNKMQNFTEEQCKFVINNSIENGWQGLFWDKLPKDETELTDDQKFYNNVMAKDDTSWFASFAPSKNPQYAVVMMVNQGGFGASTSGVGVRKIYEHIFGTNGQTAIFPKGVPTTIPKIDASKGAQQ